MLNKNFEILDVSIPPGQGATVDLKVVKLHTSTPINVPLIIEHAKKPGPVLLIMAGVHGDEVNGVAIVREILRQKLNKPKKGTIICMPVFNVIGYLIQTREFPDGRDLNRMFPGSANGSLASQFANSFTTEVANKVDYIIDLHTGGADRENISQTRCALGDEKSFELCKVFNAPFTLNSTYLSKSLRETVSKLGKSIILFEGGKSMQLNKTVVKIGARGTLNVMQHLGMHDGEPKQKKPTIVVKSSKWLRAPSSGLFYTTIENGAFVEKGELLGLLSDPYGKSEKKVKAPFNCYILCVNTSPIINKGNALFHVSTEVLDEQPL
jgi:predicted deacylase